MSFIPFKKTKEDKTPFFIKRHRCSPPVIIFSELHEEISISSLRGVFTSNLIHFLIIQS